jgi:hypothetical protein
MAPEHEPDPLVAPRSDETDFEEARGGTAEPFDEAASSEPSREPVSEPRGSSDERGYRPELSEPSAAEKRSASRAEQRKGGKGVAASSPNMLPARHNRGVLERTFVRVIATGGIVGICVAIAAIMSSSNSAGWIIGLVVSLVSVVLAAVLWSSRVL